MQNYLCMISLYQIPKKGLMREEDKYIAGNQTMSFRKKGNKMHLFLSFYQKNPPERRAGFYVLVIDCFVQCLAIFPLPSPAKRTERRCGVLSARDSRLCHMFFPLLLFRFLPIV